GVARYLPNGTLDTTFSGDGMVTANFGGTEFGAATAAVGAGTAEASSPSVPRRGGFVAVGV
ncbi:hypothetical protein, partial [Streptomyces sp. NPDC049949]|uniref:hypothetical protein n=1 Tax=Streptomyces sp. NPDC049949 TaxID=3154627 RepID=UPI00342316E1